MRVICRLRWPFTKRIPCTLLCALFCAILCSLPAAPPAAAQSNITGFWILKTPTGDGNFRQMFLDLKQDGETVTGKVMFGPRREVPISDGTLRNGALHFTVAFGRAPRTRQVTYDGTVEAGKISLTSTFPGRAPLTGIAERGDPKVMQPPARIPPPALHDVPDNGLARTPPMGWNSWNKFAGKVTDADVRGMADAMVSSGMKDAGYIYINIDDTWEGPRDANGNITSNLKFPDMKALADYVHSKGLKIGIYSSPGPKTCAGYEGSYGHEQQDANTYAAWGFDYLKYDWCSADQIYKNEDMQAVYQKMGDALLKTGRPIVFSLCQYGEEKVWTWGAKVGGNLWRTTGDINDSWKRMAEIGFNQFDIAPYIRVGHWNDPDMLEIGNGGMTNDEYKTHMSLWSLLAAPLLAGNDLRNMSAETKEILTNRDVIAIDQDPAGKPPTRISDPAATAVVVSRPLQDGSLAVGLFNRGDQSQDVTVKWSDVGLAGKKLHVRDLWKHADVAASADGYTAAVPPHGVVLLKVTSGQ
ncbi:MAG TPA: glycoside hydrolase family 27 protein [Candidatus Acidoferrales bacterium]|nr:glycoside hydrolase family 27 protein [Candidatus Acidoferrales bacterium]